MSLNLALVISGNAAGGKQAVAETRAEVRELGAEAGRTSATMAAANDQAAASAQRVTQALIGQTQAQRDMNAAVAAFAGIKPANDDAGYRQRAADIEAYGQELDRLRAKYNPLFAVERQHADLLRDIDQALKVGAISEQEHAAAVTAAGVAHQRQVQLLGSVGGAARLTSAQLLNLSRQGNDVVTMWLLGASAGQIAVSQFGQIYDALESGPRGLRGSLEAVATAGRSALTALLAFAATPPGLVAAATIAAVAGLATYIIKTKEDVRALDEILKDHEKVIKGIGDAYGLVQSKAHGAFSFNTRNSIGLDATATANELKLSLAASVQRDLSGILTDRGAGASGNQFGPSRILAWNSEFAPFADAIDHLRSTARQGQADILGFKQMVEAQWALEPNNFALAETARKLIEMTESSVDAARALKELEEQKRRFDAAVGPGGIPLRRGELSTEDTGAYDQYLAAQRIAIQRGQQAFDAQRRAIYARSPGEIAAAARASAAAEYNNDEDPEARNRRINMAGQLAQLQAQHQLDEAQKERKRSLDALLSSQRLDIDLIGRTAGQAAQMRLQFQLTQELREEAERNNTRIDQSELDRIAAKAKALGKLVDLTARINLASDLQFERDQLGRSPIEQTVASRLKGAGLEVDLGSQAAGLIRTNEILKQQVELWKDVRQTGMDAIDAVTDSAAKGFSNFGDVVENIAQDVTKQLMQLVVANPLKNAIYGAGLPTIGDVGGVGGFLGTLLGITPNPAAAAGGLGGQSVAAMTVNAGSVMITGSIGAGGGDSLLSRLFAPANSNMAGSGAGGDAASQIWNFFSGKGLQPHQVAGIMGNFGAESGFDASAVNPLNGATGIAQWLGSRLSALGPGADLGRQLQFAWQELQGPENRVLQNLLASTDVRGATRAFAGFERAEGYSSSNPEGINLWNKRLDGANAALAKFSGAAGSAGASAADFGQGLKAGLGEFADGLDGLWKNLGSFLQSPNGGGSAWFQGLSGAFGGIGGALSHMLSISPAATMDIISGSWGAFAGGGATGGNDPRRVAGLVHEEEYVMDAPVVRAVGVPFLDKLRAAAKAGRGFDGGGYGGGAPHTGDWGGRAPGNVYLTVHNNGEPATVQKKESTDSEGNRHIDVFLDRKIDDRVLRPSSPANRQLRSMGLQTPITRR